MIPKLDELEVQFRVSKPSLREALRILETEGLITVRRGNMGGAVVHAPGHYDAAYMIGLVLQSRNVRPDDLAEAIQLVEPICAAICAERPDRAENIVPRLKEIHQRTIEAISNDIDFQTTAREFHETLVALCGNETMRLVVGSLEALWSARERDWARHATTARTYPDPQTRQDGIRAHERLIEHIERGDAPGASRVARRHLQQSQLYAVADGDETIRAASVRGARV